MGGVTVRSNEGLGTKGVWRISTEEYPLGRADGLGGTAIAIRYDNLPPEHFHVWCTREEDGYQVEMEIELDDDDRPVARNVSSSRPTVSNRPTTFGCQS